MDENSTEYITQLTSDVVESLDGQGELLAEVCKMVKVADWVVSESQDAYIGDCDNPTPNFIREFMQLFIFHPYLP